MGRPISDLEYTNRLIAIHLHLVKRFRVIRKAMKSGPIVILEVEF